MAQAESQPAPGQPEGRRRPLRPGRQERHAPQDGHAPRDGRAPQERPCAPDRPPDAGVRLEHPVVVGYDGSESARHARCPVMVVP